MMSFLYENSINKIESHFNIKGNRKYYFIGLILALFLLYPPAIEQFFQYASLDEHNNVRFEHVKFNFLYQKTRDLTYYDVSDPNNHESKLSFRFTLPVILRILQFDRLGYNFPIALYLFQLSLGILAIFYAFKKFSERLGDEFLGFMYLCFFSQLYFFSQFFFDTVFFDGLAYLILFYLFFQRQNLTFSLVSVIAFFADERAIISVFLIVLYRIHLAAKADIQKNPSFLPFAYFAISIVTYTAIRLFLSNYFGVLSGTGFYFNTFAYYLTLNLRENGMLPIILSFKIHIFIFFFAFAMRTVINKIQYLFISVSIFFIVLSYGVIDTVRSISYLFPIIFFIEDLFEKERFAKMILPLLIIFNLFIPTGIMKTENMILLHSNIFLKGVVFLSKKLGFFTP